MNRRRKCPQCSRVHQSKHELCWACRGELPRTMRTTENARSLAPVDKIEEMRKRAENGLPLFPQRRNSL